jgi:IS1 family transposase
MGIRAAERLTGLNRRTVLGILETAGQKCARLLDAKMRNLHPSHVEIDEIWTFVHSKQRKTTEDHPVHGDQYCWLSLDQPTNLILNFHVAKRSKQAAMDFIGDLRARVDDSVFDLTSDGFGPYRHRDGAVFRHFGSAVNYGTEIKTFGQMEPDGPRRYSPVVCTSCRRWDETGCRELKTVTTNRVERQNLNVRLFTRRFTRLTLGYSKKLANLKHAVALTVAFQNFCRKRSAIGNVTPAMAAGLADHVWTVAELLGGNNLGLDRDARNDDGVFAWAPRL